MWLICSLTLVTGWPHFNLTLTSEQRMVKLPLAEHKKKRKKKFILYKKVINCLISDLFLKGLKLSTGVQTNRWRAYFNYWLTRVQLHQLTAAINATGKTNPIHISKKYKLILPKSLQGSVNFPYSDNQSTYTTGQNYDIEIQYSFFFLFSVSILAGWCTSTCINIAHWFIMLLINTVRSSCWTVYTV